MHVCLLAHQRAHMACMRAFLLACVPACLHCARYHANAVQDTIPIRSNTNNEWSTYPYSVGVHLPTPMSMWVLTSLRAHTADWLFSMPAWLACTLACVSEQLACLLARPHAHLGMVEVRQVGDGETLAWLVGAQLGGLHFVPCAQCARSTAHT